LGRRVKQKQLLKVSDILTSVLDKRGIRLPIPDGRLKRIWNEAVGPMIVAQTAPGRIKGETLFVKVATSVWMHQLQFLKDEILEKFNARWDGEPVRRLHLSVGEISAVSPLKPAGEFYQPTASFMKKSDKRMIEESLAEIRDEELRSILRQAMTKEIIRRRYLEYHGQKAG